MTAIKQQIKIVILAVAAHQAWAQFGGPAVLGRHGSGVGNRGGEQINFRPYAQFAYSYDSGLSGIAVGSDGAPLFSHLNGIELSAGVFGVKTWRRTSVGADVKLGYRHYNQSNFFNGSDQFLQLQVRHQATRRSLITFVPMAGSSSRAIGGLLNTSGLVSEGDLPLNEVLDIRATFASVNAQYVFQPNARWSYSVGGGSNIIERKAAGFADMAGSQARGDVSYRLSRRSTISVDYGFNHFSFKGFFTRSDVHSFGGSYNLNIGRQWRFNARGGVARTEMQTVRRVTLDPLIVFLLGRPFGIEAFYRKAYVPNIEIGATRLFRKWSLMSSYSRRVMPGNGVVLVATSDNFLASYSYSGIRRWNFSAAVRADRMDNFGANTATFRSTGGGGGFTYQLARGAQLTFRADLRQLSAEPSNFSRGGVRIAVGFAYSPGDFPLALW
ncbi:MAG: hypothetical protein FJW40_23300 [Acidobacteria bacterium]|nr:hypothetical protein [Acidobacteriota bacterium]